MDEVAQITSPEDIKYNCIAWATRDTNHFWWPKFPYHWPKEVKREENLDTFVDAYATRGFQSCSDVNHENGWEKIVIYADTLNKPKHAARQLNQILWTSKLGSSYDVVHPFIYEWTYIILNGQRIDLRIYGRLAKILKRKI